MAFKDIFRVAFPFISAAASIGGPLGTMAASAVGKALGVDNVAAETIPDAIAVATSKDPEAMLKMKQAEEEFQLQMTKLGFDQAAKIEQIASADRANARAREIAVKDRTPSMLALSVTVGFFGLLVLFAFHDVPPAAHDILLAMIGSLGMGWAGVMTYYFGSSAGSQEKTKIISQMEQRQ